VPPGVEDALRLVPRESVRRLRTTHGRVMGQHGIATLRFSDAVRSVAIAPVLPFHSSFPVAAGFALALVHLRPTKRATVSSFPHWCTTCIEIAVAGGQRLSIWGLRSSHVADNA
jgi:hypothetical protein